MTTSGTSSFNPVALNLITEAYELIRATSDEEPLTAYMAQKAARTFNLMIKAWDADGLHLWCKTEGVVFLQYGVPQYGLGGSNSTRSCLYDDLTVTALAVDALIGATQILVNDATGIVSGEQIAVEIGNNLLQWTTVNGAPAGNLITLAAPLAEAVLTNGAVFSYSTKLERPTRLLQARRRIFAPDPANWNDIWLTIQERPDYYNQPNKYAPATETMIYYDPQLVTGVINLWNAISNETDLVLFTFERPLQDITELTETADFPQEWLETLAWNLAYRLAFKTSFPMDERTQLGVVASSMKEKLLGFDREYGTTSFQPDFSAGGGFNNYGYGSGGR